MEPESALEESYVNLSGDPYYLPDKEVSIAAAGTGYRDGIPFTIF